MTPAPGASATAAHKQRIEMPFLLCCLLYPADRILAAAGRAIGARQDC